MPNTISVMTGASPGLTNPVSDLVWEYDWRTVHKTLSKRVSGSQYARTIKTQLMLNTTFLRKFLWNVGTCYIAGVYVISFQGTA